jgi:hypothetical protein
MDRTKSLSRSKKSAITVADLLAKEGFTAIIPAGGLIYDMTKSLVKHSRDYFIDRTEDRLENFHDALLKEHQDEEKIQDFINKEFNLDDYHAILSSCTQDIENEKVSIYASLLRGIIENKIEPNVKRHFITSTKDLTFTELYFLKEVYINSNFDLMTAGGTAAQVSTLLSTKDLFKNITINKLIQLGYINEERSQITSMSKQFVQLIFDKESLLPKAIGRSEFSRINVLIVSYQFGDSTHSKVVQSIQESLWSNNIKSSMQIIDERYLQMLHYYSAAVLIVDEKIIDDKYIVSLSKFSKQKPLIKINISDSGLSNSVGGVHFSDELKLDNLDRASIQSSVSEYIQKLKA